MAKKKRAAVKRSPSPPTLDTHQAAYNAYRASYGLKPRPMNNSTRFLFESDNPPEPKR